MAPLPHVTPRSALTRPGTHGSALALALLSLLTAPPARAELPVATRDRWVETRSERFVVYSNAGERAAEHAVRHLERLAEVLAYTTQGLRFDGGREIRVFVFKDHGSFAPYHAGKDDAHGQTVGFHVSGPDVELIAYHQDGDAMTYAFHEYLHAVLARSLGELPVWINEGLAEYYSTFRASRRTADIGRLIPEHVAWISAKGTMPLTELLDIDIHSPEYRGGDRRGTIYAQSWALVHMLVRERDRDPAAFSRLIRAFERGASSRVAHWEAMGMNAIDSLEKALTAYVARPTMSYSSWNFDSDFTEVAVRTRALSRSEVLGALGELAMRSEQSLQPLALEHLLAAWEADSSDVVPAGVLCELADRGSDRTGIERWTAAVERAQAPDPRASALAGCALAYGPFRKGYIPSWPARGADSTALRARRLLEGANAARPGRAEWLIPYGLTFLEQSDDLALGIDALMVAHAAAPKRSDATAALGILYARAGARAPALALYKSLRPGRGDDASWKYLAGVGVARRTFDDAEKLFRDGNKAEAESLLVQLQRDVRESGLSAAVEQMLVWMRADRPSEPAPQQMEVRVARAQSPSGGGGRAGPAGSVEPQASSDGGSASGSPSDETRLKPGTRVGFGAPRVARALSAARSGDFATAEGLLEQARQGTKGWVRAWLDTVSADVRNQRRMRVAADLVKSGRTLEACTIYAQILKDIPKPEVSAYVRRQSDRYCRGAGTR